VNTVYTQLGFETSILQVFYPFFEKIGVLWMTEHVIPAHEHFSSYLIQKKIILAIDDLPNRASGEKTVAIFAPKGERHEIPLLVVQYLFKKHGIRTVYFGCNISTSELEYYVQHHPITHLFLHVITNFCNKDPRDVIHCIRERLREQKIIASGPTFAGLQMEDENVQVIRSCAEMFDLPLKLAGN
jgi:methanogenic corrinoid protein MtbC1